MKRKGFTVVELVIVIAVVATLAAVLIPTFSSIIENANISADTQAARNMNTFLSAEVAKGTAPKGGDELITTLEENGFSRFRPQTRFYTFYWIQNKNVIVLVNDAGDPIFPEEYADESFDKDNWINLEAAKGMPPLPTAPSESLDAPRDFSISVSLSGASGIDFGIPQTIKEGSEFNRTLTLEGESTIRYRIKKVTVLMEDGDGSHKIDIMVQEGSWWDGSYSYNEHPVIKIPCVTGNISINVSFKEFCCITLIANDPSHLTDPEKGFRVWCEKGTRPHIDEHILKGGGKGMYTWLAEQYTITAATVYSADQNLVLIEDAWDKDTQSIIHRKDFTVTSDVVIEFETKEIGYTVTLVVKSQKHDVLHTETIEVPYDSETQSGACSFNLPADLWDKEVNTSFINPQPKNNGDGDDMTPTYKREGNSINVSNIKYDFTLTYFFQIPEAD